MIFCTVSTFKTNLKIHYCSAAEYNTKVTDAISATDETAAHIVLINNADMMNTLIKNDQVVDLTSYINSRDYGRINSELPEALLAGAKVDSKLYAIPNNHIIGGDTGYNYIVIDKAVARDVLHYSPATLNSYDSLEDCADLIADMEKAGYDASSLVYSIDGPYEMKKALEDAGNICNIATYPTVTQEEAFMSAFAIVKRTNAYNDRAMQIIYALNNPNDHYFRNLLLYGVSGTNYVKDESGNIVRVSEGDNVYSMNPIYTGNLFHAEYCEEINWTKEVHENALKQNDQSVVAVIVENNGDGAGETETVE